jgi:hypothetical protein
VASGNLVEEFTVGPAVHAPQIFGSLPEHLLLTTRNGNAENASRARRRVDPRVWRVPRNPDETPTGDLMDLVVELHSDTALDIRASDTPEITINSMPVCWGTPAGVKRNSDTSRTAK